MGYKLIYLTLKMKISQTLVIGALLGLYTNFEVQAIAFRQSESEELLETIDMDLEKTHHKHKHGKKGRKHHHHSHMDVQLKKEDESGTDPMDKKGEKSEKKADKPEKKSEKTEEKTEEKAEKNDKKDDKESTKDKVVVVDNSSTRADAASKIQKRNRDIDAQEAKDAKKDFKAADKNYNEKQDCLEGKCDEPKVVAKPVVKPAEIDTEDDPTSNKPKKGSK